MEKVLVMGGSYFIGKKIVDTLLEQHYEVFTLNRGSVQNNEDRITNLICDREDALQMKEILSQYSFDIVIDVSGLTRLHAEILCNSLKIEKVKSFIYISSSAVYDVENLKVPFKEEDPLKENKYWNSYGLNKIEAEAYYSNQFRNTIPRFIIVRPPYLYGEYNYVQRESFIFDHICNNQPILIPKSNPKLQFLYTKDLADIILSLLTADLTSPAIYNVGNQQILTTREWIACCESVTEKSVRIVEYDYQKSQRNVRDFFPFHDYDNILDVTKIHNIINQDTPFEEGLLSAYQWYLGNSNKIIFKENVRLNEQSILKELNS